MARLRFVGDFAFASPGQMERQAFSRELDALQRLLRGTTRFPTATLFVLLTARTFALAQVEPQGVSSYSWASEKWSGSDAPFAAARRVLENMPQATLTAQLNRLGPSVSKPKMNVLTAFRYGYGAYLLSTKFHAKQAKALSVATRALDRLPSPHAYNFDRLHFLLLARFGAFAPLQGLGLRLAKRDVNDYDVRFYLHNLLKPEQSSKDKELSLSLCRQMLRISPNRPSAYSALGSTYFRLWLATKNPTEAQQSTAAYQRYLQLAPANDPFRPQAQAIIAMMQKMQKR